MSTTRPRRHLDMSNYTDAELVAELLARHKPGPAPRTRQFLGDWLEVGVGISPDTTCIVSVPDDAVEEINRQTGRDFRPSNVSRTVERYGRVGSFE